MQIPKRYTITAALPYTNGPVHIGHLAGVYIPADIYARYLLLNDRDVVFVCGSDEHGVPITLKAKAEGTSGKSIQPMGSLFEQSLLLFYDAVILRFMNKKGLNSDKMYGRHANLE